MRRGVQTPTSHQDLDNIPNGLPKIKSLGARRAFLERFKRVCPRSSFEDLSPKMADNVSSRPVESLAAAMRV
jgi:hypothetical protein